MEKYDRYSNELTTFINLLVGMDVKDLVGDIVGDIISVDIPSIIPQGDFEFDACTPFGTIHIKHTYINYQDLLIFTRVCGGSIYEEYIIDLLELFEEYITRGYILEKRRDGVVLTSIVRHYDTSILDESKRIIKSEEDKQIYAYDELKKKTNIDIDYLAYSNHYYSIRDIFYALENKDPRYCIRLYIDFYLPKYCIDYARSKRIIEPSFDYHMHINEYWDYYENLFRHLIEGNKIIERVDSLIHGAINSQSIKDIQTIMLKYLPISQTSRDNREQIFDLFNQGDLPIWQNFDKGKFNEIAERYIGPSEVKLGKEYYEYIKELVLNHFPINITQDNLNAHQLYSLLLKKYSPNNLK